MHISLHSKNDELLFMQGVEGVGPQEVPLLKNRVLTRHLLQTISSYNCVCCIFGGVIELI